jgi:hypothetical protein
MAGRPGWMRVLSLAAVGAPASRARAPRGRRRRARRHARAGDPRGARPPLHLRRRARRASAPVEHLGVGARARGARVLRASAWTLVAVLGRAPARSRPAATNRRGGASREDERLRGRTLDAPIPEARTIRDGVLGCALDCCRAGPRVMLSRFRPWAVRFGACLTGTEENCCVEWFFCLKRRPGSVPGGSRAGGVRDGACCGGQSLRLEHRAASAGGAR